MRKLIFIIILLSCFWKDAVSQIDLVNISLKDSSLSHVYSNTYNRIKVIGISDFSDMKLKSSSGTIWETNDSSIYSLSSFSYDIKNNFDTLSLYNNNELLYSKVFEKKYIRKMKVQIGNLSDTIVSMEYILDYPVLEVGYPEDDYIDIYMTVWSFKIALIWEPNDTIYNSESISGSYIPEKVLLKMLKLDSGDYIYLYELTIGGPNSCPRRIRPVKIQIKENKIRENTY
jgi:hypothetical protein